MNTMNPLDLRPHIDQDILRIKESYLIYGDFPCEAVFIEDRRLMLSYTMDILDKIVYGEDSIYAMMLADGIRLGFLNENLYGMNMEAGFLWGRKIGNLMLEEIMPYVCTN